MSRLDDLIMQHRSVEAEVVLRERELNTCRLSIDEREGTGTTIFPHHDTLTFLEAQLRLCRLRRERLRIAIARNHATRPDRQHIGRGSNPVSCRLSNGRGRLRSMR
ncbi:hypothetical protein [Paraburkholderia sp. HP33-1]|uniref:hypothetical protein n=1 Tax=Paraburkholderia sp. HP33-1 TaxID=2883243 RepID=UPI001F4813AE|nr:hypothetical protein [Paraburkholderia sp. HP33-1]